MNKKKPKTEIDIDNRTMTINNGSEEKKIPLNKYGMERNILSLERKY